MGNVFEMIELNIFFMYEGKNKEKTCAQDTTNSWYTILLQYHIKKTESLTRLEMLGIHLIEELVATSLAYGFVTNIFKEKLCHILLF